MTIVQEPLREDRLSLDTTWEGYLKVLEVIGDGNLRATYDHGRLELMSPSERHEALKKILAGLIECIIDEAGLDCHAAGSMTFKHHDLDRGLEPDECYWIAHFSDVRGTGYEPASSPPPDLVVEIDVSRGAIDRRAIYAALKVPEIWVADAAGTLGVWGTKAGLQYERIDSSLAFPWVALPQVQRCLTLGLEAGQTAAIRALRAWLREQTRG